MSTPDEFDGFGDGDDDSPNREELAIWLSDFMSNAQDAEHIYRKHFCDLMANKVYNEFGSEGLCQLMMAIDTRGRWVSDILLEDSDLDDILFSKYETYDKDIIHKARATNAVAEMNQKIWRLRKKYAKLIVDEVMTTSSGSAKAE